MRRVVGRRERWRHVAQERFGRRARCRVVVLRRLGPAAARGERQREGHGHRSDPLAARRFHERRVLQSRCHDETRIDSASRRNAIARAGTRAGTCPGTTRRALRYAPPAMGKKAPLGPPSIWPLTAPLRRPMLPNQASLSSSRRESRRACRSRFHKKRRSSAARCSPRPTPTTTLSRARMPSSRTTDDVGRCAISPAETARSSTARA